MTNKPTAELIAELNSAAWYENAIGNEAFREMHVAAADRLAEQQKVIDELTSKAFAAGVAAGNERQKNQYLVEAVEHGLRYALGVQEVHGKSILTAMCVKKLQSTLSAYSIQTRDSQGRYQQKGKICVCGHPAGVHAAAVPYPCFNEDSGCEGATGEPCDCQKFRATKEAPQHTAEGE